MLLIFKKVSNQSKIGIIKDKIKAHILEIRLYNDNVIFSFQALGSIFKWNFKYLGYAVKPMLVLILPVMFILIQLSLRYEYRPLKLGESCLVTVTLTENMGAHTVALSGSEGIKIETPPLRIPDEGKIYWRVKGDSSGVGTLNFNTNGDTATKKIVVGSNIKTIASRRVGRNLIEQFLSPGELALPSNSDLKEIKIHYPRQKLSILGIHTSWLILFFILSVLSGFAMKGIFGVEI